MLIIVWIGVGQRRHLDQFGAAQPQHVLLFPALGFRDHDQGPVAERAGDDRKTDAGIASGRFHHEPAGFEFTPLLSLQDHPFAGAVLHRLAGIYELGLAENGAAGFLGGPLQFDERACCRSLRRRLCLWSCAGNLAGAAKSGNEPRSPSGKVEAAFAGDLPRCDYFAFAHVQPVEARNGRRSGAASRPTSHGKLFSPGHERPGIILPEILHANDEPVSGFSRRSEAKLGSHGEALSRRI